MYGFGHCAESTNFEESWLAGWVVGDSTELEGVWMLGICAHILFGSTPPPLASFTPHIICVCCVPWASLNVEFGLTLKTSDYSTLHKWFSDHIPWSSSDWTLNVNPIRLVKSMLWFSTLDWDPSDQTPSAVATCVQTMPQLGMLYIGGINPLPVLQTTVHRVSPLQSVKVWAPQWVSMNYTYSYIVYYVDSVLVHVMSTLICRKLPLRLPLIMNWEQTFPARGQSTAVRPKWVGVCEQAVANEHALKFLTKAVCHLGSTVCR